MENPVSSTHSSLGFPRAVVHSGAPIRRQKGTPVISCSPLLQTSAQSRLSPSPFGSECQMSCHCGHIQMGTQFILTLVKVLVHCQIIAAFTHGQGQPHTTIDVAYTQTPS